MTLNMSLHHVQAHGVTGAQRDGGSKEGWREQREMDRAEKDKAGII